MSKSTNNEDNRQAVPDHKMVDLRETLRKGAETIDLGDVAPKRPTNLNPFETVKPAVGGDEPSSTQAPQPQPKDE